MKLRDKAVYATSALLYSGPLYSGLAGYGIGTIPLFAAIFALWLYVVRPGDWPRFAEDWKHPRNVAWPLLIFGVQMILVAFCLAVGRGIGAMFDFRPPLPLAFTVLVSLLAISLARLLQRPDRLPPRRVPGAELGIGAGVLDIGRPEMPGRTAKVELVEQVLSAVAPSSGSTTMRSTLLPTVDQIEEAGVAGRVVEALEAVEPRRDVLTLQGMIAFRPSVAQQLEGTGLIGRLMERVLASGDPKLIEATAIAAVTLLTDLPEAAEQFPPVAEFEEASRAFERVEPSAEAALSRLAQVLRRLQGG